MIQMVRKIKYTYKFSKCLINIQNFKKQHNIITVNGHSYSDSKTNIVKYWIAIQMMQKLYTKVF